MDWFAQAKEFFGTQQRRQQLCSKLNSYFLSLALFHPQQCLHSYHHLYPDAEQVVHCMGFIKNWLILLLIIFSYLIAILKIVIIPIIVFTTGGSLYGLHQELAATGNPDGEECRGRTPCKQVLICTPSHWISKYHPLWVFSKMCLFQLLLLGGNWPTPGTFYHFHCK